ncbi:LysE family translocator [Thermodesulfobacteriota bacterium]
MTIQSWLMYLMLVIVATATPGPAVLFIMTQSTLHGWRKAAFSALGNITGLFCMGILTVTGLGAILNTSEIIFNVVKYFGAAYLVYLGVRLFFQKGLDFQSTQSHPIAVHVPSAKIFFQAFGVAVSNPKAIVFLTALFPQFLNIDVPLIPQFFILISTLMTLSFSFLMFYALVAHKAKKWFAKSGRVRIVSRTSGAIFVGFGVLLATSSNR